MQQKSYEYKKSYTRIFVFFYLIEGCVQGIPLLLFPSVLVKILGGYDISAWLVVFSIGNIPWAIKMIVGLFNDRWGSKKYGRRFPWIISFGVFGAIWWFIAALYLPPDQSIYFLMALYYFMITLGIAFADTALDGLILDVVPKERLGKIQGLTWAVLLAGMGLGGFLLGMIFLTFDLLGVLFALIGILTIIASFLPYFIEEPPIEERTTKEWGSDLISIVTKKKNWKVFSFTFIGNIQGLMILEFFKYLVLLSMNVISVDKTLLSLQGGETPQIYLAWNSIFYVANGIGTIIGSLIAGKAGDKSRKRSFTLFYLIYIPFCSISVVPFFFINGLIPALIIGMSFLIVFGGSQGGLIVAGSTIRADISKKDYPYIRSTYYALLISLLNGGQNFGTLLGAWLLTFLVLLTSNYSVIYLVIAVVCSACLLISYGSFRSIDPQDYEFLKTLKTSEKEVFFA